MTRTRRREAMKKVLPFLMIAPAGLLALGFMRLDESKRRFIAHLLKQVPYLPGRYFA